MGTLKGHANGPSDLLVTVAMLSKNAAVDMCSSGATASRNAAANGGQTMLYS